MAEKDIPPNLINLTEHQGNWAAYLDALYAVFRKDFVSVPPPTFLGARVGLRKYEKNGNTLPNGKEATFWHLISEGETEEERTPDMRRCERIGWVRWVLDQLSSQSGDIRVWPQNRNGKTNYVVAIPSFEFVVVIGWRQPKTGEPYALLLTAFCPTEQKRHKFRKEWEATGLKLPKPTPPLLGAASKTPSTHGG